jgi:ribokinase
VTDVQRADAAATSGSEDQPPLVVVAAVNVDAVVRAPRHPRPGETVLGTDVAALPGGKGANQAVASAVAGATTSLVAAVGADAEGQRCLDHLAGRGVDTRSVRAVTDATTGMRRSWSPMWARTASSCPAPTRLVTADAVAAAIRPGTAVVLVQLEVPEAAVRVEVGQVQPGGVGDTRGPKKRRGPC